MKMFIIRNGKQYSINVSCLEEAEFIGREFTNEKVKFTNTKWGWKFSSENGSRKIYVY
jgi:hypothetical protein